MRVESFGFGFRVQGSGSRVEGVERFGLRALGLRLKGIWKGEMRVEGFAKEWFGFSGLVWVGRSDHA